MIDILCISNSACFCGLHMCMNDYDCVEWKSWGWWWFSRTTVTLKGFVEH